MLQSSELKEEIQSVVEAIDNVFRIEGDLEESDVEQLHSRLVACIDAVNSRLQRCDELLRKGLKSEAIQEAEIAPKVLELVDELDAMEAWDGWADYVRQFGIPPQPNLLVDIAAALNLAYSHAQPIDRLLRQHRLFALARVPLRDRIPVLRELAARDNDTPVWKEDLKQYETTRLMQIDGEFRVADRERDLRHITALHEELERSPWSVKPAQELRNAVATVYKNLRIALATEKLTTISSEMNAAFSDFDLYRARLVRNEWERYNEIANLDNDSELVREVSAAFQWLDDEEEAEQKQLAYQRSIAELEQGLDQPSIRRVELDRLFAAAERFDSAIPDRMIRRYEERLRVLTASEQRRGILVLVGSLATLMVIGSAVGIFAWVQWRASQVSNFEESLAALIEAEKLDEAEAMIASLDNAQQFIASSPKVSSLKAELEGMRAADDSRKKRLADLLQDVVATCESDPTFEQIEAAKRDLKKAENDLVKNNDEMSGLKQVEKTLLQVESAQQSIRDKEYTAMVAELMEDARQIDGLDRPQLLALIRRARDLSQPFRISPSVVNGSQVKPLLSKLEDAESNIALRLERNKAVQRLTENIGKGPLYRLDLVQLKRIETGPDSEGFSEILSGELDDFENFVAGWNRAASGWNALGFKNPANLALAGLPILNTLSNDYADIPGLPEVNEISSFLMSVTKRGPSGKKQLEDLVTYLNAPLFKLQCVQEKSTKLLLYVSQAPVKNSRGIFEVRPLDSPDNIAGIGVKPNMGPFTEVGPGQFAKLAPHSNLALQLKDMLQDDSMTYEMRVCQALRIIIDSKNVSSIIRGQMLLKFTEDTLEGSSLLKQELSELKNEIQVMENFWDVNWFNPTDESVSRDLMSASQIIDNLLAQRPEKIWPDKVQPAYAKLEASKTTLPTVLWVGALLRIEKDNSSQWECVMPESASKLGDTALFVRYQPGDKKTTEQIGEIKGGRPMLNQSMQEHFKAGRPVWILQR